MSKYDSLRFLHETRALEEHKCNKCGRVIAIGEIYYPEKSPTMSINTKDSDLREFCKECYEKFGTDLLNI